MIATMSTGFVFHERYMWHNTGRGTGPFLADASGWMEPDWRHTENSDTKRRFRNLLDVSGLLDQLVRIDPRPATVEEVCRFHTPEYVESIRAMSSGMGGEGVDGTTVIGKGSYEVALLAAGGAIEAVDAVLDGRVDNVYALVRPAGPSRAARRRDGLLHLRQRRDRRAPRARRARARRASRSSTGTSITATARRPRSTTTRPCSRSRSTRTTASRRARV